MLSLTGPLVKYSRAVLEVWVTMSLRAATVTIHQQVLLELGWAGLIAVAHCATLLQAEHKHLPTHRYIAASCQMCRYYIVHFPFS